MSKKNNGVIILIPFLGIILITKISQKKIKEEFLSGKSSDFLKKIFNHKETRSVKYYKDISLKEHLLRNTSSFEKIFILIKEKKMLKEVSTLNTELIGYRKGEYLFNL
jgi:hypothetical protein